MKNDNWESLIKMARRLGELNGQTIDPKEIMSPSFNKVFPTKEEAIRDGMVQDYKRGQPVNIDDDKIDDFVNDLIDDLLDRI